MAKIKKKNFGKKFGKEILEKNVEKIFFFYFKNFWNKILKNVRKK